MNVDPFADKAAVWDDPKKLKLGRTMYGALLEKVGPMEGKKILDYGAGTGIQTALLAAGGAHVTALEVSEAMGAELKKKCDVLKGCPEIKIVDDLKNVSDEQDGAVVAMVMHHVVDVASELAKIAKKMKPGAWLAAFDLEKEDGDFHPDGTKGVHHNGFSKEARNWIIEAAGLQLLSDNIVAEIPKNDRIYSVFLLLARRA
jgi:putative AdoMet-dependent methyltransferase